MKWMVNKMDTVYSGRFIQQLLNERNMTRSELAKLLKISRQAVSNNLSGSNYFKMKYYILMADLFDVSINELIFGGYNIDTELEAFANMDLDEIDLSLLPDQPDMNAMTLLDYVIGLNDFSKFIYFYNNDCFIQTLHNNIVLIEFLIRNNCIEFLSGLVRYSLKDTDGEFLRVVYMKFEFPLIDDQHLLEREKMGLLNSYMNYEMIDLLDAILNCRDYEMRDLIIAGQKANKEKFISSYTRYSIINDDIDIFTYLVERKYIEITQYHTNLATGTGSSNILLYIELQ